MYNFIAESFSVLGMVALVASFQIKNSRVMFGVQCLANALFCVNYLMFAEYTSAALMVLGMCNPVILILTKGDNKFIKYAIMLVYLLVAVFTYKAPLDIFLCIAQLCGIMAQWTYRPRLIRWVRLCASPFWLAKNIHVGIFITLAELFTFISIVIFLIRTRKDESLK